MKETIIPRPLYGKYYYKIQLDKDVNPNHYLSKIPFSRDNGDFYYSPKMGVNVKRNKFGLYFETEEEFRNALNKIPKDKILEIRKPVNDKQIDLQDKSSENIVVREQLWLNDYRYKAIFPVLKSQRQGYLDKIESLNDGSFFLQVNRYSISIYFNDDSYKTLLKLSLDRPIRFEKVTLEEELI